MFEREAYIVRRAENGKRVVCIDRETEATIMQFLQKDPTRLRKFGYAIDVILMGLRIPDIYDKEDIDGRSSKVTAIKLFKGGQNIRLYCKEQTGERGCYYIIIAELLEKKKSQKVTGKIKSLIQKIANYEYKIVEREENH